MEYSSGMKKATSLIFCCIYITTLLFKVCAEETITEINSPQPSPKLQSDKAKQSQQNLNFKSLKEQVLSLQKESDLKRSQKKYNAALEQLDEILKIIDTTGSNAALLERTFSMQGDIYLETLQYNLAIRSYLLAQQHVYTQPKNIKLKLWDNIAFIYTRLNENYAAIKYYKRILSLLMKENDLAPQAKVLLNISRSYKKVSVYNEALTYGNLALQLAKDTLNDEFTLKSLLHLSTIYRRLNSYENALDYGFEALNLYQKNGDFNGIASSLNTIGLIYNQLGQRKKAKIYFEKVINLPQESIQPKYYAAALREIALFEYYQSNYARALSLSQRAYNIFKRNKDVKGQSSVKKNLGLIYQAMGEIELSFEAFTYSVETAKKTGDVWEQATNLAYIALLYAEKAPKKAKYWGDKSLKIAKRIQAAPIIEQIYLALSLAEENMGNFQQALVYAKLRVQKVNEIKQDAINKHAAETHVLQNVMTKIQELELLKQKLSIMALRLEQQKSNLSQLTRENSDDKNTIKYLQIIILIIFFLLTSAIFITYLKKLRRGKDNE